MAGTLDFATFMNTMKGTDSCGFGGGNSMVWLLLIIFLFGGNGGLFGSRGVSAAEQTLSNDFLYSNLNGKLESISGGIVQGFSGVNSAMNDGFNRIGTGIANVAFDLKSAIDSCCCETQTAIQRMGYEDQIAVLNQTNVLTTAMAGLGDKIDSQTALMLENFCAIKSREDAREIAMLQAQLAEAKTVGLISAQTNGIQAQLAAINNSLLPKPIPAYVVNHPFPPFPCGPTA